MSTADTIKSKATELMQKQSMFTSVDVGNAIKKEEKQFISNSEVAKWLRRNFSSLNTQLNVDYTATQINVNHGQHSANLYHHFSADPDNYTDRDQTAMTVDEFKKLHGFDPLSHIVTPTNPTVSLIAASLTQDNGKHTSCGKDRVKIPAKIVKQLGLKPGDSVKASKFAIPGISNSLKVHKDNRISVSRKQLSSLGKGFISIGIKDGILDLQKA